MLHKSCLMIAAVCTLATLGRAQESSSIMDYLAHRAARCAAQRAPLPETAKAWPAYQAELVERLATVLGLPGREPMKAAVTKHKRFMKLNMDFHFKLYEYGDSPFLFYLINLIWARTGPYYIIHHMGSGELRRRVRIHEDMLAALKERDADKLAALIRKDAESAQEYLVQSIQAADD